MAGKTKLWEMASRVNNEGRKSAYVGVSWHKRRRKWFAWVLDAGQVVDK